MNKGRVAIPTNGSGGINGIRSEHFGHCDSFTLVDIEGGKIISDYAINNASHEHGGCMVPVTLLANNNVSAVIVVGIGRRPLSGFEQSNIDVYIDKKNTSVENSVLELVNNRLKKISVDDTCGGGGNCH